MEIYNDCSNNQSEKYQSNLSSDNLSTDPKNVSANEVEIENKYTTPKKILNYSLQDTNSENISTNMTTYAFMSTYNNLPSSLSPSTRFLNQTFGNEKKEKNKKPWYSVSKHFSS